MSEPLDRHVLGLFLVFCGLAILPVWTVPYPPMVDLAQHAAQVSIGQRWGNGSFGYDEILWINWRTPYVLTNLVASVLANIVSVGTAFKLVVSLSLLGLPVATLALIRESGGRPAWSLITVPLGYSFSFYMGFVAYAVAVPLALLFVLSAWRYAEGPTTRRAVGLLAFSQVLFLTHTIAFGWAGLTGALIVAARAPSPRAILVRWWPFAAALVLPAVWIAATLGSGDITPAAAGSGSYGWSRWLQIFSFTVGLPINELSLVVGVLFFLVPWLTGGRPPRDRIRWIPFLVALGLFLVTPNVLMATAHLHQRFVVLLLPTLLFALDTDPSPAAPASRRRWLLLALPVLWLAWIQVQFLRYEAEVGGFGELLDTMEPDRFVLYLPFDRNSAAIPYPVYLHLGNWYLVEKGGMVDYSFAEQFPNRYRYLPSADPLQPGSGWRPGDFDWSRDDGARYDYFLVRSSRHPGPYFVQARAPVTLLARAAGDWWLFAPRPGTPRDLSEP